MCEFCKWDPEFSDDGVGFSNDLADTPILINDTVVARMILSLNNSKKKGARMEVELNCEPTGEPMIAEIVHPIHYCPFCGKKLD